MVSLILKNLGTKYQDAQIEPEQALAAFESKLKREELDAW
jgi:hypothetical protein